MKKLLIVMLVGLTIGLVGCGHPLKTEEPITKEPVEEEVVDNEITKLIEQLGDNNYAKREAAQDELFNIGKPALLLLRKAKQDSSQDPEIRLRAECIISEIESWGRPYNGFRCKLTRLDDVIYYKTEPPAWDLIVEVVYLRFKVEIQNISGRTKGITLQPDGALRWNIGDVERVETIQVEPLLFLYVFRNGVWESLNKITYNGELGYRNIINKEIISAEISIRTVKGTVSALQPGKYKIRAEYHWPELKIDPLVSNTVEIEIRDTETGEEK